jgi:hypothetical protein
MAGLGLARRVTRQKRPDADVVHAARRRPIVIVPNPDVLTVAVLVIDPIVVMALFVGQATAAGLPASKFAPTPESPI